jgi:GAF domain-containing protein
LAERLRRDLESLTAAEEAAGLAGERVAHWWKELGDAAETALTQQSLDSLLREALLAMKQVVNADAVALLIADESQRELIARAAVGLPAEIEIAPGIRIGQGMAGRVMETRRPFIVHDLSKIQVASATLRDSGLVSIVAVPLLSGDRLVGVLHAGSHERARFHTGDARLMELMASRLAGAIERVRLFEQERAARLSAEHLADRLTRMQQITSQLAAVSTAEEAGAVLAETLTSDVPGSEVRWSSVWLVREDHLEAVQAGTMSVDPGIFGHMSLTADSPLAAVVRSKRPAFVSDRQERKALFPSLDSLATVSESFAILPILLQGECEGILVVAYPHPHRFLPDEQAFLTAVVVQTSQAFERARLYSHQVQLAEMTSFFAEAAKMLAEAPDFSQTMSRLAHLALRGLGDICLIDVVGEDGTISRMVALHKDPRLQQFVRRLATDFTPDPAGGHPAVEVIRTGKTRWGDEMSEEFLRSTTRNEDHFSLTKTLGFRSYLAVPLISDDEVLGSMTLVSCTRPFKQEDVSFAEQLARQVAAVVDNAKRYDVTFKTSRILQASLLPQELPLIDGLEIHTTYVPGTRALDIGGDFYDVIPLPSGKVGFMVGDVAGHDRGAAAMMGHLRSAARALMGQVDGPAELLEALQWSWTLLGFERIATGIFGELDCSTGELVIASAGHYPPLLVEPGPEWKFLQVESSPVLGAFSSEVEEWRGYFEQGSVLLLYTDGAIDERTVGSDMSMRRLAEIATDGELDPGTMCERIIDRLEVDGIDDIALMAIRRSQSSAQRMEH